MKVFLQLLKMRILSVFKGTGKKDKYTKNIGFKIFIGIVVAYAALCFVGMFGFYFMQLAKTLWNRKWDLHIFPWWLLLWLPLDL